MNKVTTLEQYLTLKLIPGVGVQKLNSILEHFTIEEFLALDSKDLQQLKFNTQQIKAITRPNFAFIEQLQNWSQQPNQQIITHSDPNYPEALKQISSAPLVLFLKGRSELLDSLQLSIIGSRSLTITGQDIAFNFAQQLAAMGFTITSGLAIGVDGFSHKGALAIGGNTIAVLGSGLHQIYPKRHKRLAAQIAEQGLLLSEFYPNQGARAEHFPRRNRIISGLSQGTLVIEAAIKSGSLITARYAMEQGREVFAIPGSIFNPMSKGCHHLIKQGAKLVEDVNDIIEELPSFEQLIKNRNGGISAYHPSETKNSPTNPLISHIGFEPTSIDAIAERSLLPINDILAQLLDLELEGQITAVDGGYLRK